jgi:gliding motility-associated-like protein
MRQLIALLSFLLISLLSIAQGQGRHVLDQSVYDSLKSTGALSNLNYQPQLKPDLKAWEKNKKIKGNGMNIPAKAAGCVAYQAPDTSYTLVLSDNDDGSTPLITIPFDFCFYGDTINSFFINNNGNISFNGPFAGFDPSAFPSAGNELISPFWGDVDTRNGFGTVWVKTTPTAIFINWFSVGYFSMQGDKLNSFELILTNGTDPFVQGGNVAFLYGDMQWTTGDFSGGSNGFGNPPGTAGANKGDNVNYFLLGQFDHAGVDYDGAAGNNDGISWLDYKSFFFDVCSNDNIAPVPNGLSPCDTFRICSIGDTADFPIIFLSPEQNQTTSINVDFGGLTSASTVSNTPGNVASVVIRAWGEAATVGLYNITVTATDNYTPVNGVTSFVFTVQIDSSGTSNFNPVLSDTVGCDSLEVGILNGPYDSYLWEDQSQGQTYILQSSDPSLEVTVERNGCFKRIVKPIRIAEPFFTNLNGEIELCTGVFESFLELPDSASFSNVNWNLGIPDRDTMYSNVLDTGFYTLHVEDSLGICKNDTNFSIVNYPLLNVLDDTVCGANYQFSYDIGGSKQGHWTYTSAGPTPVFADSSDPNTTVTFPQMGYYYVVFVDSLCMKSDTAKLTVGLPFTVSLSGNTFYCPSDSGATVQVNDSLRFQNVTWGGDPFYDGRFSNKLVAGTYSVTLLDSMGACTASQTLTINSQPKIGLVDDIKSCDSIVILTGNIGGSGSGFWTEINGNPAVEYVNPIFLNQKFVLHEYGVYTFVYQDDNCPDNDTLIIEYFVAPGYQINDFNQLVCPEELVFIEFLDTLSLTSVNWFTGDPAVDSLYTRTVGKGTYTYSVEDSLGCVYDSLFSIVERPVLILKDEDPYCGDSIGLAGNIGIEGGQWYKISGPGKVTFSPIDSLNPKVKFSTFGNYRLAYKESTCMQVDTMSIDVRFYPYIEVGSYFGCSDKNPEFVLFDAHKNLDEITWSNGDVGVTTNYNIVGTHYVTVENVCGEMTAYFNLDGTSCNIRMPNVFTPNDDLINQLFKARYDDAKAFRDVDFRIFNRWGQELYQTDNLFKGWPGRDNSGAFLADGVYFYTFTAVDLDNEPINLQGSFHLVGH